MERAHNGCMDNGELLAARTDGFGGCRRRAAALTGPPAPLAHGGTRRARRTRSAQRSRAAQRRAAQRCASASAARWRRSRRCSRSSSRRSKALPAAAAQAQAADDRRHGAGLGRRLLAVLGLGVRGGLRGAAVRARDGPRDPAAPRGASRRARRCSCRSWARLIIGQVARRERAGGGARGARRARPRHASAPAVCLVIAEATDSDMLRALAYVGFFLNLFNLLPVVPLDGGRAMAAMAPWMWFLGLGAMVALALVFPQPVPVDLRAVRRHGDLAALEAARHALARAGRLLPRLAAQHGCSWARSTSG